MEKISVIVPIHNNEQYLKKCLCSITRQTYSTLEIILIDDGSTDQSLEICYDFKEQDNRIKVISTKQHGVGATRNLGLKNATGYYVAFVDSDDYICADMFEYLYSLLKQYDADIAICGYKEVDDNDAVIKVCNADKEQSYTSKEAIRELAKDGVMKSYLWNKLFKHSLFKDIKFPENLMFGEDLCTTYKLFLNAKLISCGSQIKYFYVKHSGSITNQDKYRWQSLYSLELFKNAISP